MPRPAFANRKISFPGHSSIELSYHENGTMRVINYLHGQTVLFGTSLNFANRLAVADQGPLYVGWYPARIAQNTLLISSLPKVPLPCRATMLPKRV